ncbi:MAG: FHA domain-containing protein [Planctomycetota bacterium]|jgi:pSer/pThr/pTyr-binding forkhead associated (FHA) protein
MPSVTILFGQEEINAINLSKDVYIIGRQENCEIRIDNLGISRNHARIIKEGGSYLIEDLGSSNGTFLNGEKTTKCALSDEDVINIGKYEIKYLDRERTGNTMVNVQKQTAVLPEDTMNTMEMNSDDIQKKFAEMSMKNKSSDPSQADNNQTDSSTEGNTKANDAEIKAREAEIQLLKSEMEKSRTFMLVIAIVAVVAVLAAIILLLK